MSNASWAHFIFKAARDSLAMAGEDAIVIFDRKSCIRADFNASSIPGTGKRFKTRISSLPQSKLPTKSKSHASVFSSREKSVFFTTKPPSSETYQT
jgi:hypothetical protein